MKRLAFVLGLATLAPGCPAQPVAPQFDTGPGIDAAHVDAATGVDATGIDAAGLEDAGTTDAGLDAAASDAGADTGADVGTTASDGGHDAAADANVSACVAAGGMCVPLVPGSCATGTIGAESCGGGLGVECCHPHAASAAPVCMFVGTPNEGWYQPDGTMLCAIACAGLTATCQRVGTTSQGWYTTMGHGCPPHSTEIVHDDSCTP